MGICLQAFAAVLVPVCASANASDYFFVTWSAIQICSVIGQYGNGWKAMVTLSQGGQIQLAGLLRESIVPTAIGCLLLIIWLYVFKVPITLAVVAAALLLYICQTYLMLLADVFRGCRQFGLGNFLSTGAGNMLNGLLLLAAYLTRAELSVEWIIAVFAGSYLAAVLIAAVALNRLMPSGEPQINSAADPISSFAHRRSRRAFVLRVMQMFTTQAPTAILNSLGVPFAATTFALAQRFAIFSSVFVVNLNSMSPAMLSAVTTEPELAQRKLVRLSRVSLALAAMSGALGLIPLIGYQQMLLHPQRAPGELSAYVFGSPLVICYLALVLGQLVALSFGAGFQSLLFLFEQPYELYIYLTTLLVLVAVTATFRNEITAIMLATLLAFSHGMNGLAAATVIWQRFRYHFGAVNYLFFI